ncbi:MAG: hypothetical protein IJX71_01040 [Oscillospiraceae bacterium]|nr:hypothetical protein [Oscillospiraceae bacterium]
MKKRCTNPSCRSVFALRRGKEMTCPRCGKVYPRLSGEKGSQLLLTGILPGKKLSSIKALWALAPDLSLRQAKKIVDHLTNAPYLLNAVSHQEAQELTGKCEAGGFIVQAKTEEKVSHSCAVLLTGYASGKQASAAFLVRKHTGKDVRACRALASRARTHPILLGTGLEEGAAQAMVKDARQRGVHAHLEWRKAG